MSTELEQARIIAERIARRVAGVSGSPASASLPLGSRPDLSAELAAMRSGLSELQQRLARIEARVGSPGSETFSAGMPYSTAEGGPERPPLLTHSPWLAGVNATAAHASQERFGVEEAVVSELVDYFQKEKTCSLEPGGKPCDHCAMCSSRGF